MIFVVDIGNSRLKWGISTDEGVAATGRAEHGQTHAAAIEALTRAVPSAAERVVVANVGGREIGDEIEAAVRSRHGIDVVFAATRASASGLRCAYPEPSRLGVDRWAALAGAFEAGRACVVVDAGTTVTVDVLGGDGLHRGGLILAGPELVTESIARRTAHIARFAVRDTRRPEPASLFGRDTEPAVVHGALLAAAAGVDRAVAAAADLLASTPHVILTGGLAPTLADWVETRVEQRPDLVLEGLGRLAAASEEV